MRVSAEDSGSYACLGNNGIAEERAVMDVFIEGELEIVTTRPLE